MTRPALLLTCLLAALPATAEVQRITRGQLVVEGIPEIPSALVARLRQWQQMRSATVVDWTPQGALTVRTRFAQTAQLHLVDMPMGARRQITFFEEPVGAAAWSPTGARPGLAFTRDVGGNEDFQLYYLLPGEPEPVRLTDGRGRVGGIRWTRDGTRFAFTWTARTGVAADVYLDDPADGAPPELVFEAPEPGWSVSDVSADGRRLLLTRYVSVTESYGYVYDIAERRLTEIEPRADKAARIPVAFTGDDRGVYFTSDAGSEFRTLRYADLATGRIDSLSGHIPWDVEDVSVSNDRRRLAYAVNEDGYSRLLLLDLERGQDLVGPGLPRGLVGGLAFDPAGERIALSVQTPTSLWDAWVWSFADSRLERWTQSEVGPLDPSRFVTPALVHYPTFDRVRGKPRQVPAFVYRPAGPGPHPVVINIHGGPESQARPVFSPVAQQWVSELGYAVIYPNVRGSSGYGKTYVSLDNGMKREDSVRDIGALLDWIGTQPDLDASRVVVFGGSYGGYMALASLTHYNDRLRGGVDVVGISNFVTFLESTAEYRRDLRRPEYGDERDPAMRAFLERISPLNNAQRISKPLFVVQGRNDPRVPWTEAEQIVAKVRANGGDVWYLMALNEGHGFAKRENADYLQWAAAMFLERMKEKPAAVTSP